MVRVPASLYRAPRVAHLPRGLHHGTSDQGLWPCDHLEITMKRVKILLLGSAAGLVAVAGAQAADLPVKAKPVEYVKICSLYRDGFFYIPGTDTCLKIGGWVRWETDVGAGGSHKHFITAKSMIRHKNNC